jgi:hypothetical protein
MKAGRCCHQVHYSRIASAPGAPAPGGSWTHPAWPAPAPWTERFGRIMVAGEDELIDFMTRGFHASSPVASSTAASARVMSAAIGASSSPALPSASQARSVASVPPRLASRSVSPWPPDVAVGRG